MVSCPPSSTFLNNFFSETAGLILTKFPLEALLIVRSKAYSRGPDHMAKMAVMPIYSKTSFVSLEKSGTLKLGMNDRQQNVQIIPWKGQICIHICFYRGIIHLYEDNFQRVLLKINFHTVIKDSKFYLPGVIFSYLGLYAYIEP